MTIQPEDIPLPQEGASSDEIRGDADRNAVVVVHQDPELLALYGSAFKSLVNIAETQPDKYPVVAGVGLGIGMVSLAMLTELADASRGDLVYVTALVVGALLVLGSGVIGVMSTKLQHENATGAMGSLANASQTRARIKAQEQNLRGS